MGVFVISVRSKVDKYIDLDEKVRANTPQYGIQDSPRVLWMKVGEVCDILDTPLVLEELKTTPTGNWYRDYLIRTY